MPHFARRRAGRLRRDGPPGLGPPGREFWSLRWRGGPGIRRQRSSRPGRANGTISRRHPAPVIVAARLIAAYGPVPVSAVEVMQIRTGPAIRPSRKRPPAVARSQITGSWRADSPAWADDTGSPPASGVAAWVGVRLAGLRPVAPAAGLGRRPCGLLMTPGGPAVRPLGLWFWGALHPRPRTDVTLQIGPRLHWPRRRLMGTTVGVLVGALGRPVTALLAARKQICAFARPPAAANLSCLPAGGVFVSCSQRFRPDALPAELAQPVLGVFLVVAPVVWCLAIIPPPAHRYLHDQHLRGRAHGSPPRGCARTPPLLLKGPMRAGAPQPACAMRPALCWRLRTARARSHLWRYPRLAECLSACSTVR
ncbi:MAG TPA: hypothetical protein VH520_10075 [Streptosporangiaceae bacterium]